MLDSPLDLNPNKVKYVAQLKMPQSPEPEDLPECTATKCQPFFERLNDQEFKPVYDTIIADSFGLPAICGKDFSAHRTLH